MFSDFSVLIMIERFSSASRSDIKAVLVSEGWWQEVKICWEQDNLDENNSPVYLINLALISLNYVKSQVFWSWIPFIALILGQI